MIIENEQGLEKYAAQLDVLFAACFGGLRYASAPRANWRSILLKDGAVAAHAALQERVFNLPNGPQQGYLLGLVGVLPTYRGQNLGLIATCELLDCATPPVLLNCGQTLVGYYQKLGFRVLSSCASYDRNGEIEIDPDPVMIWNETTASPTSPYEVIHLGNDF